MMKNTIVLFLLLMSFSAIAQNVDDVKYNLTTSTDIVSLSMVNLLDPYLSPSKYEGFGFGYDHHTRKLFKSEDTNLSTQTKFSTLVGLTLNPQFTAQMTYMGADYSWGMHYSLTPMRDLQILVGGTIGADFAFKWLSRNVNNPINMDIDANVNFSAVAAYDIHLARRTMKLKYEFEAPIYGCMFVPMGGASYYEMFELGNLDNTIHFSSLHNKQAYDNSLRLEIPFKRSTWQFGLETSIMNYKANDMIFNRSIYSLEVGWKYNIRVFRGMKNQAPQNFIHPNF